MRTSADLAALVAAEFEISSARAAKDCEEFLAQLLEIRAIESVAPTPTPLPPPSP